MMGRRLHHRDAMRARRLASRTRRQRPRPREEPSFQTQLTNHSQLLRQQGGGVTKAWKPAPRRQSGQANRPATGPRDAPCVSFASRPARRGRDPRRRTARSPQRSGEDRRAQLGGQSRNDGQKSSAGNPLVTGGSSRSPTSACECATSSLKSRVWRRPHHPQRGVHAELDAHLSPASKAAACGVRGPVVCAVTLLRMRYVCWP